MAHVPHPLADAEALFLGVVSRLNALASIDAAIGPGVWVGMVAVGVAGLAAGFALRARRPPDVRRISHATLTIVMTRSTLSLFAALCLAVPAAAQSTPMARLAPFEGTYILDGEPHLAPDGAFDGTLTIAPVLGGHFQQWDWQMTMRDADRADETVHLRFVVGYDPATSAYTIHRFDSRDASSRTRSAGAFDAAAGRLQVDGDALVMAWSSASADEPARTGTFRNRVRLTDGGLHVETEGVRDDGSPVVAIATTRAARR